ncbi:MAG: putative bifunctional diguanylate cyclase/phosphodiesterase [Planctomycetaceae bacterium]
MDGQCIEALLIENDRSVARDVERMLAEYEDIDNCRIALTPVESLAEAVDFLADAHVDAVLMSAPDEDAGPSDALPGVVRDAPLLLLSSGTAAVKRALDLGAVNCLPRRELNSLLLGRTLRQAVDDRRLRTQIAQGALRDSVTGLPNRPAFVSHLATALEREARDGVGFAVFYLDLDHFKKINDSLGHGDGDRFLLEITRRLAACIDGEGVVSRFGGDEFAILVEGVTGAPRAAEIAELIHTLLHNPVMLDCHEIVTSVSIGIVLSSMGYASPGEILRDAEIAMYRAKAGGRSDYQMFDHAMRESAVERLQLERELRRTVAVGGFQLVYQPIVRLQTGNIVGFETLIRWNHPERGFVSPARFIPIAEETGLIVPIGRWVLREACNQMQRWKRRFPGLESLRLSVNLSSRELLQSDLIDQIDRVLSESGFAADCLDLEITESAIIENDESAAAVFGELKARDIRLSIDDFGMGYSSLSYLHRFAFDSLKIDRSFVSRLGEGEEDSQVFVQTIITLAATLGMRVVGEGVETEKQRRLLTELDCDFGQGYLFARPIDRGSMPTILAQAEAAMQQTAGTPSGRAVQFNPQ